MRSSASRSAAAARAASRAVSAHSCASPSAILACDASAAYAQGGAPAAEKAWASTFDYPKEDRQPEHVLVYGGPIPLSELLAPAPRDDEAWHPDEASRFGVYARCLWAGLLDHESVDDR